MPNFAPKAKRVIYLFMSGGPSQLDLWDYKPQLDRYFDQTLPIIEYYKERHILCEVNGEQSIELVTHDIMKCLE